MLTYQRERNAANNSVIQGILPAFIVTSDLE